jgi:1-acyl-sn-glycerol-3-phosphate acyltransferase
VSTQPAPAAGAGRRTPGTRNPRDSRKHGPEVPHEQRLGIRLLHLSCRILARVWHHTIVLKRDQLPTDGAAILVCNHTSGLDPLLIQSVVDRVIVWMMAKEYYEISALTWVFRMIEAIPVERDGRDSGSLRAALRHLKDGRILGVFPEGRIERTRELMEFQTGVALMAIKTGVPVYPAFLDGTQRNKSMLGGFLWPNRATLAFGPPVEFDRSSTDRDNLEAATEAIKAAVNALRGPHPRR